MRIEITEKNYKEASICIVNDIFNKYIKIVKHIHNTRGDIHNTFKFKWNYTDKDDMKLEIKVLQNGYFIEKFEYTLSESNLKYVLPKMKLGNMFYLHEYSYTSNGDSFSTDYYLKETRDKGQSIYSVIKCYIDLEPVKNLEIMLIRRKFMDYVNTKFNEKMKQHNDVLNIKSHINVNIPRLHQTTRTFEDNKIKLIELEMEKDINDLEIRVFINFSFKRKTNQENTLERILSEY
jgi:hypothetical protein